MRTKRSAKIWACSCNVFSIRITSDDSCTASAGKTLSDRPSVWQEVSKMIHESKDCTHKSDYNVASSKLCRILKDDRLGFTLKGLRDSSVRCRRRQVDPQSIRLSS